MSPNEPIVTHLGPYRPMAQWTHNCPDGPNFKSAKMVQIRQDLVECKYVSSLGPSEVPFLARILCFGLSMRTKGDTFIICMKICPKLGHRYGDWKFMWPFWGMCYKCHTCEM